MSTATLNIESKTTLVPKLRFMGFDEEWKLEKFGNLATNKSGKFNPIKENSFTKCIELEHLETGTGQLLGFIDGSNSGSIKNKFNEGDVLFGKLRPYLKKYLQAPFEGVCSSEIWVLKGVKITNSFLYQIVQTNKFIDIANQSSGSKMPRADWNVVENCVFTFTTLPEQQKIASFLSAVDEKIQQLSRKKELLEQYKKGVMQQLFSGELKFKDENGNDYADWKSVKMNELFSFKQGIQCGVEDQFFEKTDNMERFIRIIDLTSDNEIPRFINNIDKGNVLFEDDLFMVRYGVPGLIGFGYNGIIANNLFRLIPKKNVHNKFYFYVLTHLKKDIMNLSSSTTMPALNFSSLGVLKIPEIEIKEQKKITNFLSSIDIKIESTSQQIIQMQSFKKGLLQQLFV